ncbi:hypothetical protein D5086_004461 [Populus alba]|uniref:Uncharacterized protein n=2 Tax=Populus TaxID=3689 RepID=A0ACC4CRV2_POPAL|nr:hypothetical protein NC653_005528 [Populus alba x Populus x berolinensis]
MIARNISKEDGGETWDDIDAGGDSTGRIPAVVVGASTCTGGDATCTGGDAGVNGRVISDSGAGASATALESAKSNLGLPRGLKGAAAGGGRAGPSETGPANIPVKQIVQPSRQAQSMPVLISDFNELQQLAVGGEPLLVLPVIKLTHGVKLDIIDMVHGVLICPFTEITSRVDNIAINLITSRPSIISFERAANLVDYKSIEKNRVIYMGGDTKIIYRLVRAKELEGNNL